jgi:hypothetical protein
MWRVCDQNVSANPYLHTCVDGVCVRVSQQLVCRLISWEKQRSDGSRSQVSMRPHRSKRGAAGKTDSRRPMFQIGRRWRERRGGDGGGGGDRWWSQRRSRRWIRGGEAGGGREDGFVVVGILDWEAAVREKRRQRRISADGRGGAHEAELNLNEAPMEQNELQMVLYSPDQAAQNPPADDAFNVVNNPQSNQNSVDQAQGMEEAIRNGLMLLPKNLDVDPGLVDYGLRQEWHGKMLSEVWAQISARLSLELF